MKRCRPEGERFTRWWIGFGQDGRANQALGGVLALVCLTVALVGVPRLRIYGHDIFIALDGAWRVVNGQRPAIDFFAQMGPAYYLLHAAGLRLAGNAAIGLGYSSTIAVAVLSVWSFVLLRRRMRPAPFFLACVFLALLTAAPFPLGHSPWQTSFSMKHNRYGFALTALVLLESFLPDDGLEGKRPFWGGFSTGLAAALLLFLKTSFGLVGLTLAAVSLAFRRSGLNRLAGMAAGLGVFSLPMLVYLRFDVPALTAEFRTLVSARDQGTGGYALAKVLYFDRFEIAPYLLLALLVCLLPGVRMRRALTLALVVVMAVLAGGMLMVTNTSQHYAVPLLGAAALVLMNEATEASRSKEDWIAAMPPLALGLMLVGMPASLDAGGLLFAVKDKFAGSEPGYQLEAPHLAGLEFVSCREKVFGYPCSPNDNGAAFVRYTQEGMDLIRANSDPGESVRGMGMSNPFSYGMLRRSARGGTVILQGGHNVRWDAMPPLMQLIGDAALLLIPKFEASERNTLAAILGRYPDLLGGTFIQVAESENWILYRRRK